MHDRSGINAFTKTIGYGYDAVHNRIGSMQQPGDWQYNADNQLVQFGAGTDQTTYTYTANGHVATKTEKGQTLAYTYDATNRLISIADTTAGSTEIARYAYDPMGRRISKKVGEEITYYLYTAEGLIAELDKTGNMTVAYGWQADAMYGTAPLWQAPVTGSDLQTADYHYLITDHLGTPQLAVNSTGQTTWKAYSEAFGKTTPDATNQITMNLRFPGQYFDQETNTHYNYFRDYDSATGRYIQSDPIGLGGGINLYAYVWGNPMGFIDSEGLEKYKKPPNPNQKHGAEKRQKTGERERQVGHDGEEHSKKQKGSRSRTGRGAGARGGLMSLFLILDVCEDYAYSDECEQAASPLFGMCEFFYPMIFPENYDCNLWGCERKPELSGTSA